MIAFYWQHTDYWGKLSTYAQFDWILGWFHLSSFITYPTGMKDVQDVFCVHMVTTQMNLLAQNVFHVSLVTTAMFLVPLPALVVMLGTIAIGLVPLFVFPVHQGHTSQTEARQHACHVMLVLRPGIFLFFILLCLRTTVWYKNH